MNLFKAPDTTFTRCQFTDNTAVKHNMPLFNLHDMADPSFSVAEKGGDTKTHRGRFSSGEVLLV